jgi:hypothetical protein
MEHASNMITDLRLDTVKLGNLLSVAEQIQAFGLARKTGEIYITNAPAPARINLVKGEVVDAQFGLRSGLPAAVALINLPDPQTEFIVGEEPPRQTIDMPYMQVLCEAARALDEDENALHLADRPTERIALAATSPALRVTLGTEIKTFPIRPGVTFIGRSTLNEIVINDATMSQRHASIEYSRDGLLLKDLGSTNGTYVGTQRVQEHWLSGQESLRFGGVTCAFVGGLKKAA